MYANYLDRDDDERVNAAFGDSYDRRAELKTKWDPNNPFQMTQTIEPTDRSADLSEYQARRT